MALNMLRVTHKMFNLFTDLVCVCNEKGCVDKLNMNDTYASIDVVIGDEKYLVTVMKEENKNDPV